MLSEVEATEPRRATIPNTPLFDYKGGTFSVKEQKTDAIVS